MAKPVEPDLEIQEFDEAGNLTATYVQSSTTPTSTSISAASATNKDTTGHQWRVDVIDSLQAFSSSIAGLISSRAVLEGIGVGDTTASPTAALLLSIMQECMGRMATILFAHRFGTAIEPECKMYRLAADVFNDAAMVLDCLSPAFPKPLRVFILGSSSALRAICGVAAGSSKASLSQHFARWGNIGELNAKDSSQETVISLLGMLAGSIVVSHITSTVASWVTLITLLSVHLAMNYAAVRAVRLRTVNRQRANILFSNLLDHQTILDPAEVSTRERIFMQDGVLQWKSVKVIGSCRIGCSLKDLVCPNPPTSRSSSRHISTNSLVSLAMLARVFQSQKYILNYCNGPSSELADTRIQIALKQGVQSRDQIQAWLHALLVARMLWLKQSNRADKDDYGESKSKKTIAAVPDGKLSLIEESMEEAAALLQKSLADLTEAGWDLDVALLETSSGTRVEVV